MNYEKILSVLDGQQCLIKDLLKINSELTGRNARLKRISALLKDMTKQQDKVIAIQQRRINHLETTLQDSLTFLGGMPELIKESAKSDFRVLETKLKAGQVKGANEVNKLKREKVDKRQEDIKKILIDSPNLSPTQIKDKLRLDINLRTINNDIKMIKKNINKLKIE